MEEGNPIPVECFDEATTPFDGGYHGLGASDHRDPLVAEGNQIIRDSTGRIGFAGQYDAAIAIDRHG
ncbi:hypothetical protein CP98_04646 [Sphingobium yanoikuyae]|uniref:Uncharacterized protein n=1 Tax=Sphingobium yanoikuyae TaxID=13690 RepID=A0A084EA71_SPHYA|nr:hypothetical protein CP98_04646 [Sphingobium yanoikuyae]